MDQEIAFWDSYIASRGLNWPEDFRQRLDPDQVLAWNLREYLDETPGDTARILDVGAGPLTRLGKTHPSKRLEIVPTDPLAPHYDRLLAKHGIEPPVRTIAADAEALTKSFPRDSFDLATAFNSLDHSYDPLQAIREIIAVIKPSRCAVLLHIENEAENENYNGLHQWSFTAEQGDFLIRNLLTSINVTHALKSRAAVQVLPIENGWITVLIRKRSLPDRAWFGGRRWLDIPSDSANGPSRS